MYRKGTVILVPFPFTDLKGSKVRPAVIISKEKIGNDLIVVFVTSQPKLSGKHVVLLQPSTTNGIKAPSKVVCSKIATLENTIVLGELGSLSKAEVGAIDRELRKVLGI